MLPFWKNRLSVPSFEYNWPDLHYSSTFTNPPSLGYDVFAGAAIGTVFAFSSYRMCYAAIWDWRWNHVPLHRNQPCLYTSDGVELMDAMWTRKAGWGVGPASGKHASHRNGIVGPSRSPNHNTAADDMV
jgi:diacylglycerol diphosphate phosphatase / phosphatidate phosphatase